MINYAIKNLTVIYLFRFFYLIDTINCSFIRMIESRKRFNKMNNFFVVRGLKRTLCPKYRISAKIQPLSINLNYNCLNLFRCISEKRRHHYGFRIYINEQKGSSLLSLNKSFDFSPVKKYFLQSQMLFVENYTNIMM